MSKEFMKVYNMPFKAQEIKDDNSTNFRLQFDQAFEEMTKSFSEQQDEIIINYLYEKYKDTKVSDVWVLSKPDFEKFLLEMLPKWKEPKHYQDGITLDSVRALKQERDNYKKILEIIKEKNVNVYWFKSELLLRNISYRYYVNNFGSFHNGLVVKLLDEEEFDLLKEVLE